MSYGEAELISGHCSIIFVMIRIENVLRTMSGLGEKIFRLQFRKHEVIINKR